MKKVTKKLSLNRETVRSLHDKDLQAAHGGATVAKTNCRRCTTQTVDYPSLSYRCVCTDAECEPEPM